MTAALHPDAQVLLDGMAAAAMPPFEAMTPDEARTVSKQFVGAMAFPLLDVGAIETVTLPGGIAGRLYRPPLATAGVTPAMLFLHGGGWVVGDLDSHDDLCRKFCVGLGAVVLAVDYRLAPDHCFPAAVEDAFAAMRWLAEEAPRLGIDPARIAVGGDSAGGGLAAVVAIAATRGIVPPVAFQTLIYPVTDLSSEHPSYARVTERMPVTASTMRWFRNLYVDGADATDWRASPLRAPSLEGVARAFVLTLHHDPLCDEGIAYAARLADSGVPMTHLHFSGHMHGLVSAGAMIRDAETAMASAIAATAAGLRAPLTGKEA